MGRVTDDSDANNHGEQKQTGPRQSGKQSQSPTGSAHPPEQGSNVEHQTPTQPPKRCATAGATAGMTRRYPPPANQNSIFRRGIKP